MIKTVTSGKWLSYGLPRHLAASAELGTRLVDRLLAISTSCSSLDEREFAREFGYSQPHLRRLCRESIGESAHSFVLRIRLERAAMRLAAGHSVASSALEAFFESREAFARSFAAHFGCAPSEFQRLNRNRPLHFPAEVASPGESQGSVKVRIADSTYTTFLYDGPILLGRTFSDGRIDWRSNYRRDARRAMREFL